MMGAHFAARAAKERVASSDVGQEPNASRARGLCRCASLAIALAALCAGRLFAPAVVHAQAAADGPASAEASASAQANASAATGAPSADETTRWARAAARRDFNSGVERFQAGDFRGALRSFRRAYNAFPHPAVLINVAHCYEEMGDPRQAIAVYERFLAEASDAEPRTRQEVRAAVVDLRRRHRIPVEPATPASEASALAASASRPLRPTSDEDSADDATRAGASEDADQGVAAPSANTASEARAEAQTPTAEITPGANSTRTSSPGLDAPTMITGGLTLGMLIGAAVTGISAVDTHARYDRDLEAFQSEPSEATRRRAQATADRARALAWATDVLLIGSAVGAGLSAYFYFTAVDGEDEGFEVIATPQSIGATYGGSF